MGLRRRTCSASRTPFRVASLALNDVISSRTRRSSSRQASAARRAAAASAWWACGVGEGEPRGGVSVYACMCEGGVCGGVCVWGGAREDGEGDDNGNGNVNGARGASRHTRRRLCAS